MSTRDRLPDRAEERGTALAALNESDTYRLLASERCTVAFDMLSERTAPVELEDLARAVAAFESEGEDAVDEATIRLHHVHLPKLDELGLIDYDRAANRVVSCP